MSKEEIKKRWQQQTLKKKYFKLWSAIYIPTSTPIATTIIESETIISIVVEDTPNVPTIDEGSNIISRAPTSLKIQMKNGL